MNSLIYKIDVIGVINDKFSDEGTVEFLSEVLQYKGRKELIGIITDMSGYDDTNQQNTKDLSVFSPKDDYTDSDIISIQSKYLTEIKPHTILSYIYDNDYILIDKAITGYAEYLGDRNLVDIKTKKSVNFDLIDIIRIVPSNDVQKNTNNDDNKLLQSIYKALGR